MLRETLLRKLDELVERHGNKRESVLPVLQDLQAAYGVLGEETINEVARPLEYHRPWCIPSPRSIISSTRRKKANT